MLAKKEIVPLFLILLMAITAIALYKAPCVPDLMPTHWNAAGQIDAWSSKNFALFFFPAMALVIYLLITLLPRIDPFKKNYQKFDIPYYFIRLSLILFFALLYFYSLGAGVGLITFNIRFFIIPLMGLLFIMMGAFMPKIKRNFFVGFRSPWALQSDEVWQKTHQFGGKIFVAMGCLTFVTIFLGEKSFLAFMILILAGSLMPFLYSYILYRKMGLFNKNNS